MSEPKYWMVFDCESIGLHGEAFAVGWVVINAKDCREIEAVLCACDPDTANGEDYGRTWVQENCPQMTHGFSNPKEVREFFWSAWVRWRDFGALLVTDCGWPVEARFLIDCVEDDKSARLWTGPYPLHDVATARLTSGDPYEEHSRYDHELPEHNPLTDARLSARLWMESIHR